MYSVRDGLYYKHFKEGGRNSRAQNFRNNFWIAINNIKIGENFTFTYLLINFLYNSIKSLLIIIKFKLMKKVYSSLMTFNKACYRLVH